MRLVTTDTLADGAVRHGSVVFAAAVSGANVLRDMREAITNTLGGKMSRYETVLEETIARALETLSRRAAAEGYDGVLAVKVSHPVITDGAVEVVVTGTGFWFVGSPGESARG